MKLETKACIESWTPGTQTREVRTISHTVHTVHTVYSP